MSRRERPVLPDWSIRFNSLSVVMTAASNLNELFNLDLSRTLSEVDAGLDTTSGITALVNSGVSLMILGTTFAAYSRGYASGEEFNKAILSAGVAVFNLGVNALVGNIDIIK